MQSNHSLIEKYNTFQINLLFFLSFISIIIVLYTTFYISKTYNKEPFPKNDSRNFNSWEHVKTLDKFFMTIDNHNEIDNDLKNFSI